MKHHKIKIDIQAVMAFNTITTLVQKTNKGGSISYHLQTDILDTHGNFIPLTTAYANIAKLEALEYAAGIDLKMLKFDVNETKETTDHD